MNLQIHLILKFNFESINSTKLLGALRPAPVSFGQFLFTKINFSKFSKGKKSPQIGENFSII
jgi:hypothetical protein